MAAIVAKERMPVSDGDGGCDPGRWPATDRFPIARRRYFKAPAGATRQHKKPDAPATHNATRGLIEYIPGRGHTKKGQEVL